MMKLVGRGMAIAALATVVWIPLAASCKGTEPNERPVETGAAILLNLDGRRIIRVDGSGQDTITLLADPTAQYLGLNPAPDGSVILLNLLSAGNTVPGPLYQVFPDGHGLAPFSGPGDNAIWSPDGLRLGWVVLGDNGKTIILTDRLGGSLDTVGLADDFSWSPDGNHLAITYAPTNTDPEIGTIDLLGNRQRVNRSNNPFDDRYPSWSPDGGHIAFYSARNPPGLYVMNADGAGQRFLVTATFYAPPLWSPDGLRLTVADYGSGPSVQTLRIVDLTGAEYHLPPELDADAEDFRWSPSGSTALVATAKDSAHILFPERLFVVDARLQTFFELPVSPQLGAEMAWLRLP